MDKTKAISDEQLIAALINCNTIKAAAEHVGLSERAIYNRMQSGEFQALYKIAKTDLIRNAVTNVNKHLGEAIKIIAEIMKDKDNNPAIRLQAAQTLLNNSAKFAQRLSEAEAAAYIQIQNNKTEALFKRTREDD
jgi:hypothetical protein